MPPLRTGLVKRKRDIEVSQAKPQKETDAESTGSEELFPGDLTADNDDTDSEHESQEHSDTELDKVLFEDDDSTLGDDTKDEADTENESSDLTDSEAEDSDKESDGSDDELSGSEADSQSEGESGLGQTHSSEDDEVHAETPSLVKSNTQTAQNKQKFKVKEVEKKKKVKKKVSSTPPTALDRLQIQLDESHIDPNQDEYASGDSSDEEDRRNTVGDVPAWWYDEYPHVGYDLDGRRLMKPPGRDQIDDFLKKCEDPDFWRTVRDPTTGQDVVLSKEDLELLSRIKEGRVPNVDHNAYEPWVEWFSREVLATPLRAFPEHKRSFLPSRTEQAHVARLVHALKMGWTKTRRQLAAERHKKRERRYYDLWGSSDQTRGLQRHIPAPRRPPPAHAESYNPPPEYLLDKKEMKEWNKLSQTPWKRKYTFLPQQHSCLRHVSAYPRYTRERFLRCLDLYLAPRAIKMRLTINPEDLVPKLPSPRDLQPFPTAEVLLFKGHTDLVRSCDFDPSGQYVVSGSDDGTIKVWESASGRCLRTMRAAEGVSRVLWTPARGLTLLAAAAGPVLQFLNPGAHVGAHRVSADTDRLLEEPPPQHDTQVEERVRTVVQWNEVSPEEWETGVRIALTHFKPIIHISWHARGDYLAVSLQDAASRAVVVHQLSRRRSQLPFTRNKGAVQAAEFHPTRPLLFVATQRTVRVYDLAKQELVRKLQPGAQWLSTLALHPGGDHVLLGSYDRKLLWFDLDLSARPYHTLRLHGRAVRALAFHPRYPLFASAGDDPYIVVSHGMVYNDLLQNPLLVPLKQLPASKNSGPRGDAGAGELSVLGLKFHPTQPWLLAARADHTLALYA